MDTADSTHQAIPLHTWRVLAEGRVQGVGFRCQTTDKARELGVTGWVRNEYDGSVRAVVQHADPEVLAELTHWMRNKMLHAFVANLEIMPVEPEQAERFESFEIRR